LNCSLKTTEDGKLDRLRQVFAPGRRAIGARNSSRSRSQRNASAKLSGALRVLLAQQKQVFDHLQVRIDEADAVIQKAASENEASRRPMAILASDPCGDRNHCRDRQRSSLQKGREFAAWLEMTFTR
jgi:hypothetical protein